MKPGSILTICKPCSYMTNRCFNLNKLRIFGEYTVKDWLLRVRRVNRDYPMELKQLATGRMTRKGYVIFGRIRLCLDKPGQDGSNAMFSLVEYAYVWTGSPQVTNWQIVLIRDLCLSCDVHPTLFGPCNFSENSNLREMDILLESEF